jgi:hypothetical protein
MKLVKEFKPKFDVFKNLDKKKHSIQFLPTCLLKESKVENIFYNGQKIKSSYLIDIVHNLILKYYFTKENSFNLSSVVLKEKYGHLYNYYINYLSENNVLKLTKKHLKGKNARVYKLDDNVFKKQITRFKNSDRTLLKKYKNAVSSVIKEDFINNKIDAEIKKKLVSDLFYVEIDYSRSIFFLDSTIQDYDIYQRNKYSVECINDKHIFYHFDNYGRMHTNFTILKSFLRKNCLLIDGEETFEIDIKNSQPLFLTKLIEQFGLDLVDSNEFELFKFLTKQGKFYEHFMNQTTVKEKKIIKECIYKVFFGKNYPNKYDKMFEKSFPTIYIFIKHFKKINGGYKTLSYNLQNLESDFIYNKVIKEITNINPNIHLLTVHDSIICPSSQKNFVKEIFDKYLDLEFGVNTIEVQNSDINIYSYV